MSIRRCETSVFVVSETEDRTVWRMITFNMGDRLFMKYQKIKTGTFLVRKNRFVAEIELDGERVLCHVKNTGRCRELFVPGVKVILQECDNPSRKTRYDLIAVYKNGHLINVDSQVTNTVVEEWVKESGYFPNLKLVRREVTYGASRFDLYVEYGEQKKAFIEVKGVTLEEDGIARFPDAPTLRGLKHVEELIACQKDGYEAYLFFVVQMKHIRHVEPNWKTHPEFGNALQKAADAGVHLLAYDCLMTENSIQADLPLPVIL